MTVFDALTAGHAQEVDLLVTHTRAESRIFLAMAGKLGTVTDSVADEAIDLLAPDPRAFRNRHSDASAQERLETVLTDWMFRAPTERIAALHTASGGTAYLGEFNWTPSGAAGGFGPTHATDVPLDFGNPPPTMPGADPYPTDDRYLATSKAVRAAWTAFATTGKPGWADYSTGTAALIDDGITEMPYQKLYPSTLWDGEQFAPIRPGVANA